MSSETIVRDLAPVRSQELAQRERSARDVLKAWAADWLPADAGWQPEVQAVCSTESAIETPTDSGSGAWQGHGKASSAWAGASDLASARLAALMSGRERTSPALPETDWAWQAAGNALADLHARMLGGEPTTGAMTANDGGPDLRRLSGVTVVKEASLGLSWAWAAVPPETGKPVTAVQALTDSLKTQRVQVAVGLGEVDITMSDLLALQIGDVIRFPALLKSPVPLSIGAGEQGAKQAGQVQLGQQGGHVAVKLSSSSFK